MIISGLQKLTLLDYPGHTACTIFTSGCNFRCPFCHNALLVNQSVKNEYTEQEIFDFLNGRINKLDGVCVSGGEPLLQPDIFDFLCKIKSLGFLVKVDTNGSNPRVLKRLIDNRVCDFIAMDIKNGLNKYCVTSGVEVDLNDIQNSIRLIMQSEVDYEFRTTVTNELHDEADIVEISRMISGAKAYYLQRFKDSGNILGKNQTPPSKQKLLMLKRVAQENGLLNVELRGID